MTETARAGQVSWTPWGFWATVGLGLLVLVVYGIVAVLAAVPFVGDMGEANVASASVEELMQNPALLIATTLPSAIAGILLILLIATRRKGVSWTQYLAIHRPTVKELFIWLVIAAVVVALLGVIGMLLDQPAVPDWWLSVFGESSTRLLLVLTVVVVAPLFEELLFRGLLFTGWTQSKLGVTGTILLTTVLWTALHAQYQAFDLAQVFVLGIFLGVARHRSGSLVVPVAMHAFVNMLACLQVAYLLEV